MMKLLFISILFVKCSATKILVENNNSEIGNILIDISKDYFKNQEIITIFSTWLNGSDDLNYFSKFVEENYLNSIEIFTTNDATVLDKTFRSDIFIIEFCNLEEIYRVLSKLFLLQIHKFIILPQCYIDLTTLVKYLWSLYISNFIVISKNLNIYTWFPFNHGNCGNNFNLTKIFKTNDFFPNKISSFELCPIKIKLQYVPPMAINQENGAQIKLINHIAEFCNFTPIISFYNNSNDKEFTEDYLLAGLNNKSDDLALPLDTLTISRHNKYDYSTSYFEDGDVFCGRSPLEIPKWFKLAEILSSQFYYTTYPLFSIILITYGFSKLLKIEGCYSRITNIFGYYVRVILGVTNNQLPINGTLRLIYGSWLLFALVFSVNNTSILFQHFQKPKYVYEDFAEKMQDYKMLLPIYYNRHLLNYLNDYQDAAQRFEVCNDILACSRIVIEKDEALVGMKFIVLEYYTFTFETFGFESDLTCYKIRTSMNYLSIYMKKNYFMKDALNEAILYITGAGLVNYALENLIHGQKLKDSAYLAKIRLPKYQSGALNFDDFLVIFIYIFGFLMIALLIFFIEIIHYRFGEKIIKRLTLYITKFKK